MSLINSYNISTVLQSVYDLGYSLIRPTPTVAYTIVSSELATAAAAGEKVFTINIMHNAINSNLELKGDYLKAYTSGILASLLQEGIFEHQVVIALNTKVSGTASIDLMFSF